jgi:hypothetical protein
MTFDLAGLVPSHASPRGTGALLALALLGAAGCGGSSGAAVPATGGCAAGDSSCVCTAATYTGKASTALDLLGRLDPSTDTLLNDEPFIDDAGTWRSCTQNATAALAQRCVSLNGTQAHLLGATPTGSSLLVQRGGIGACGMSHLWLFDGAYQPASYGGVEVTSTLVAAGFNTSDGQRMALTPDALTIVGLDSAGDLQAVTRPAVGAGSPGFGPASAAWFGVVNAALGPMLSVALSVDGLHLYVAVAGTPATHWEATRSSTSAAFESVTLLAGTAAGQINDGTFEAISGATEGGRTLFVTKAFATKVFTRPATGGTYAPANGGASLPIWFAHPIQGCARLLGTMSPGGCGGEGIGSLVAGG